MCRLNAVVCERSSHDQYDKVAQDRACLEHVVRQLKKGSIDLGSDDASVEGQDAETSDDESANEGAGRRDNASQCGGDGVSETKNAKEEESVAAGDDDAQIERIGVKTGNDLIDQFESVYFGTAFSFIFSYNCGFPDMPAFSKKETPQTI